MDGVSFGAVGFGEFQLLFNDFENSFWRFAFAHQNPGAESSPYIELNNSSGEHDDCRTARLAQHQVGYLPGCFVWQIQIQKHRLRLGGLQNGKRADGTLGSYYEKSERVRLGTQVLIKLPVIPDEQDRSAGRVG
ncbi:MAG TPA: hypothetical protein VFE51_23515 [Verrucomicrobiae bacterium]|nr:hypothetical protein [Verrucomicrobiae bacterium]